MLIVLSKLEKLFIHARTSAKLEKRPGKIIGDLSPHISRTPHIPLTNAMFSLIILDNKLWHFSLLFTLNNKFCIPGVCTGRVGSGLAPIRHPTRPCRVAISLTRNRTV